MEWDEPKAPSGRTVTLGEDLSDISVRELEDRITRLRDEITRVEAVLAAKKQHSAAAAQLFGKS